MKATVIMDKTLIRRTMLFIHTKTMPLTKMIKTRRMELLKIGNGNLSQMISKFLIYHIIMMGPMGWRQVQRKYFLLFLSVFLTSGIDMTYFRRGTTNSNKYGRYHLNNGKFGGMKWRNALYKRCFLSMQWCFGCLLILIILEDTLLTLNQFQEFVVFKDTHPVLKPMEDEIVKWWVFLISDGSDMRLILSSERLHQVISTTNWYLWSGVLTNLIQEIFI